MKVFILTEGGRDIGFGHLTRSISLYQAFKEKGIAGELIVNGDESILDLLRGKKYRILNWLGERDRVSEIISGKEIVAIDSYLAELAFYNRISAMASIPVYIDDNIRLDYPEGIVVNGSIFAEEMNYPKKEGVHYLLGVKYFPLRKEFWEVPEKAIKESMESVMVTFGGDDMRCMTREVLKLLVKNHPGLIKKIIIGRGFRNVKDIERLKDKNTDFIYYPDGDKMKGIMLESDIAISLGGQTLYELARIGVPTIAVAVADNQLNNIKGWAKAGFIEYAGWWEDSSIFKNIDYHIGGFNKVNKRIESHKAGRSLIDGKGSMSIVESIKELKWKKIF